MTDDDEPSDRVRVGFGSRAHPQMRTRSRLSQPYPTFKASPLLSFSKSLQDARKNADALVFSAQNNEHVRKFKDNLEELENKIKLQAQEATSKLNGMKKQHNDQMSMLKNDWHFPRRSGPHDSSTMRKSYSATDFSQASTLQDRPQPSPDGWSHQKPLLSI